MLIKTAWKFQYSTVYSQLAIDQLRDKSLLPHKTILQNGVGQNNLIRAILGHFYLRGDLMNPKLSDRDML